MKLRNIRQKIRVALAWEVDVWNSSDAYLTEHNSITNQWRHRKTMASSGSLWISPWVDGKPPRAAAPPSGGPTETPPSGGSSGVKPRAPEHKRDADEFIKAVDEHIALMAAMCPPKRRPAEEKPFHRLSIAKMPDGGFTVSEHRHDLHRGPIFKLRFAGNIADSIEFIRVDMLRERGEEEP